LAILLSFVLAAPVSQLQRVRVPRGIAVVGVVLFAFAVIFALGSLIASQLTRLLVSCRSTSRPSRARYNRCVAPPAGAPS
jgi:predicted PurR-regulated permease PerM